MKVYLPHPKLKLFLFLFMALFFAVEGVYSQSGKIYKSPTSPGSLILDPNQDGYVSSSTAGFSGSVDFGSASEIGFHALPTLFPEIKADTETGTDHTDLIGNNNGSTYSDPGSFMYNDGTNTIFRQRLVGGSSATKGYSFFFDTNADGVPNYEVILRTGGGNAGVQMIERTGEGTYVQVGSTLPESGYVQRSLSGSINGDQTVFYEWYIPNEQLPSAIASSCFRIASSTITSASKSYLQGGTLADLGGLKDSNYNSLEAGLRFLLNSSPCTNLGDLEEGGGFGAPQAAAPTVSGPIYDSATTVSGTSIEKAGSSITLTVFGSNGTTVVTTHTTTVSASNTWEVTGLSLTADQILSAKVNPDGKTVSKESNRVTVFAEGTSQVCTPAPLNSTNSGNKFNGTIPGMEIPTAQAQVTLRLYAVNADGSVGNLMISTNTADTVGDKYVTYDSFVQNGTTGNATFILNNGGSGNPYGTSYYVTAQRAGLCESDYAFNGAAVRTATPVITTATILESSGSQSISGTSTEADGTTITVYKNNDDTIIGTTTVSGGNWNATISAVVDGDQVYARASANNIVSSKSNVVVVGQDQTDPPVITGSYTNGDTTINGYTLGGGQTVRVYIGGTKIGETTSDAYGSWSLTRTLSTGEVITADAQAAGEAVSKLSASVNVLSGETNAPVIEGGVTSLDRSNFGDNVNVTTTVSGATYRYYIDGELFETTTSTSLAFTYENSNGDALGDLVQSGVVIHVTAQTTGNSVSVPSNKVEVTQSVQYFISADNISPETVIEGRGTSVTIDYYVSQLVGSTLSDASGVTVNFTIVDGAGSLNQSTGTTNSEGKVTVVYTTAAGDNAGERILVKGAAMDGSNEIDDINAAIDVIAEPSPHAGNSTVTVDPAEVEANGTATSTVSVTVRDSNNKTIAGLSSGDFSMVLKVGSSSSGTVSFDSFTYKGLGVYTFKAKNTVVESGTVEATVKSVLITQKPALAFVSSAATQIRVETANDGSGTVVSAQNVTSGSSITVYAISRDGAGNFVGLVSDAVWSLQGKSGGVADGNLVDNDDGSAVFTGALVGTATIRAGKDALTTTDSGLITVVTDAAVGSQSTLTPTSASINADGSSTQVLVVQPKDAQGNTVTNAGLTVTITKSSGSGTIGGVSYDSDSGTYRATVTSASSVGSGVFVATLGGNAVQSGGGTQTQSTISYVAGSATALRVTMPGQTFSASSGNSGTASDRTAGGAFDIELRAVDSNNNVVAGYSGNKTLSWSGAGNAPDGTTPSYSTTVSFTNGVATTVSTTLYKAEQNITLTATQTGGDELSGSSSSFNVVAGAAETIAIQGGNNQNATVGTTVATNPSVIVTDANGNPVSGVSVTFAVASGGGSLAITDPVTSNSSGIATSAAWTLGTTAGTNTLSVTSTGLSGSPLTITATGTAGTATQLVFTQQPTNSVSTVAIDPAMTVEFRDTYNNLVQSNNSVTLSIENNAAANNDGTLSGTTTRAASNGVATFMGLSINKTGNGYTLEASSGSLDKISSSFNITPGNAAANNSAASVPGGTAGQVTNITITVRDAGGNPVTGQQGNLAISFDEGPNSDATFSSITDNGDGTYSVSYTPTKTGDDIIAITLNDTAIQNSPFTSTVVAGAVASFTVQNTSNGNIPDQTAGQEFTIKITALDGSGNVVTGFTGTVNLTLNKNSFQSGGGTTANFVAGVLSSHTVQINTASTGYQITATQTGDSPSGTSNSFDVVPASGNTIVITTQPVGGASGSELATQPVVEVQDALNNRVTSFTGQITVSIHSGDDGTLSGTTQIDAVAGVTTYTNVVLAGLVSEDYVLRFSGSGLSSANSNVVKVTAGPATRLAITGSSTQTAGTSQNLTITAYDAKGNVATGYNGDKELTFSGSNASPNGINPTVTNKDGNSVNFGSVTTTTFNNGIATVSTGNNGSMTLYNAGSSVIAAEDNDDIKAEGADRLTVTVNNGNLESFAFVLASPQINAVAFTGTNTLTALDSWGNTVTGFDSSANPVTISSTLTGSISGLGSGENNILNQEANFTNGVANLTSSMKYTGTAGTGTFTATAGEKTGTSGSVIINAGSASQIAIHEGNNQKATVGTAVSTDPSVIVRDVSNNPVSGVSVTFSLTGGGGSITDAVGTTNSNGIIAVGSWTLGSNAGTNTLNATITGSSPAINTSISAEGLPVPDLSINDLITNDTTPDITGLSDEPEGTEVTVTLKDSSGNDVVDSSGSPVSYKGTVDADGKWIATVTNPLGEGEYETTATIVNGAGTTKSVTGSLTIDTTPPLLTVNDTVSKSKTPTITGTSDQPEGSNVTVKLKDSDGNPVLGDDGNPLSYTVTVDGDGNWSVNVTKELDFAEYTIEATTTDNAGNTTTATGKLSIEDDEIIVSVTNVSVPNGRIDNPTIITVTLQDQNGNPVSGRADLLGFGLSGSNGDVELSEITDNGDGTYSVRYTPLISGEDLISITLNGTEIDGSPFKSIISENVLQLVFTQSPNEFTEAGFPFGTVIVELRDNNGKRVVDFSGSISIDVTEGTGGPLATNAELIGTTTVSAVNGVATFEGIIMERSGNNFSLTATASEVGPGISDLFNIVPGPPWQLVIRERDAQAELIDQFLSTFNLMAASKTQNTTTANNEVLLEGNRIPMYMVILDEYENVTFVEEGDTQVEITTSSASGRFFLQQTSNDPIDLLTILRNQRITYFYYEDPNPGELTISGRPIPPAGAREIRPGETPIVIRKPGRIRATPKDIVSEINVREAILISLQDDKGQRVFAPDPGVTITLSSSSIGGQFYSEDSGGIPIESTVIRPAESSTVVYYQDRLVGTHTLTMNGTGVPNPTDTVQFTIEQAGTLSALSVVGPDTLYAGEQGGIYRLVLQDEFKNEIVTDRDLTFSLNLEDGVNSTFYLMEENSNELLDIPNNQITIPEGKSNAPFYLSQTQAGDKILEAHFSDEQLELSAGKPIHFTPDYEAMIMAMIAGNKQQELVMHQLPENLTITIIDQYDNPITNKEVIFSLRDTPMGASAMELMGSSEKKQTNKKVALKYSGNMDMTVSTDSTGISKVSFVMGDRAGDYIIEAFSSGLEPLEFTVTAISLDYMLHQNYPNPFDNVTKIKYEVPELSDVRIEVYDMIGRRIAVLVNEPRDMGIYDLDFDANRYGLSAGVYIYRMIAMASGNNNGYSMVRRMVYVK